VVVQQTGLVFSSVIGPLGDQGMVDIHEYLPDLRQRGERIAQSQWKLRTYGETSFIEVDLPDDMTADAPGTPFVTGNPVFVVDPIDGFVHFGEFVFGEDGSGRGTNTSVLYGRETTTYVVNNVAKNAIRNAMEQWRVLVAYPGNEQQDPTAPVDPAL
jgi:hypothetical protein